MHRQDIEERCPFCQFVRTQGPIAEKATFFAKHDKYPVSPGHVLLIPRRHIVSFFELSREELGDFFDLLLEVRDVLEREFRPDGYNVGVNIGSTAGQTITHLHIHVIPRYVGDVENPAGGVRGVIPSSAEYPHELTHGEEQHSDEGPSPTA